MRIFSLIIILFVTCNYLSAQQAVQWSELADLKVTEVAHDEFITTQMAEFGEDLIELNNQEIRVKGFIIPLDALGINFVLSRNPNASCFFCGGAGPETILDIKLKPSAYKKYTVDQFIEFKGILKLNESNDDQFIFQLVEAEEVE